MPEIGRVRAQAAVLADPARRAEHDGAAFRIIDAVYRAVTGMVQLQDRFPAPDTVPAIAESEDFLITLGVDVDRALKARKIEWPPPNRNPPSVVADLLFLYRFASQPPHTRDGATTLSLQARLVDLQRKTTMLLANWNAEAGVAVASGTVDNRQGQRRNTAASLLAALALGISLLQGPGALHHFPSDVADLGRDAQNVATVVVDGVSRLLDHLTDQFDELNR